MAVRAEGPSNHRRLPVVPDRPPPGNGGEQTSERARRTPNGRQTLPHAPPLAAGARRGEPGVLWRLPPHRRACEHASPAPLAPIRSGVPRKRWASVLLAPWARVLPAPPPLSGRALLPRFRFALRAAGVMLAYYLRTGGVLASLQAGACAVGGGLGSSTTSALRGAGAAVLSAHARPYSPEVSKSPPACSAKSFDSQQR